MAYTRTQGQDPTLGQSLFGGQTAQNFIGSQYQGADWANGAGAQAQYDPSAYTAFNPSSFGQGMGSNYENATNQQLSGQLSASQMAGLNQQFGQNLSSVREQGYGMPGGAEKGLEYQAATQNALNAATLGQQNIAQGQSSAMNYLNAGQQNSQFGSTLANNQSQFGANYGLQKAMYEGNVDQNAWAQANKDASSSSGIFGGLLSAGANALTGGLSGSLFGAKPTQSYGEQFNVNANNWGW